MTCAERKKRALLAKAVRSRLAFNVRGTYGAAGFDCQKFVKVKMRFMHPSPVGASQSEGFQAAATDLPLETLHAEQQNGRPSTD